MTQRKMERITGWVALVSWSLFFVFVAIATPNAVDRSQRASAAVASPSVPAHQPTKHAKKPPVAATVIPQTTRQDDAVIQFYGLVGMFLFVTAFAATSWWNWRRKQRVRAEIRAEAWGRESLESRRRDSRAARV